MPAIRLSAAGELTNNKIKVYGKEKQEKDVLLMLDEKTGEVRVVAGLKGDGTPNLTDATAKNSPAFLHFDRHGDVLDNFFKNFYLQCKDPSRFGFYRIAADQAEQLVEVMKDLLKDPEANKEMLASHKVDTSKYTSQQTTTQEQPKQEDMEQKKEPTPQQEQQPAEGKRRGYEPIDESKIDWADIETRYGVRRDDLEKSGDLKKRLNYCKSDLVNVSPAIGGERFPTEAHLSFKRQKDGSVSLTPHFIRKEPDFKQEYKGHTFSEGDIKNLKATGNMGRKVELLDKPTARRMLSA